MGPLLIAIGFLVGSCLSTRRIGEPPDGGDASPPDGKKNDILPPDGRDVDIYTDAPGDAGPDLGPDACTSPTLFRDFDGDDYGNPEEPSEACAIAIEGYVANDLDCDDEAEEINPDAMELHDDDVDNDCDGIIDNDSWRMVATGNQHSCGLRLNGAIQCWGLNDHGQAPEEVLPGEVFTQVSAGGVHSCGLLESGSIYCWGRETEGQTPLPPSLAGETFSFVNSGWDNACGIKVRDNTVVCWGNNVGGQSIPPPEFAGEVFSQVGSGWRHTCGLKIDGTAACWGNNGNDQTNFPAEILFSQISAGWGHNCGIVVPDNTVDCWGEEQGTALPAELRGEPFEQISACWFFSCGILTSGAVRCWGANAHGQSTPPAGTFIQVGVGKGDHACGVTTENTIRCWGDDDYGQAPDILSL